MKEQSIAAPPAATPIWLRIGTPVLAIVAGLAVNAFIIRLSGASPVLAFEALVQGALGTQYGIVESAVKACPLLLTGLAVALAFRCGVWNIGAEGQFLVGAMAGVWAGVRLAVLPAVALIPCCLTLGFAAGAVWAWVPTWLKLNRQVQEVISTIMMNFIAIELVSYAVHGPLQEASGGFPQSDAVAAAAQLPRLLPPTRFHLGILIALLAAVACWILLYRTPLGLEIRAVGANAAAARSAGIDARRPIYFAMLVGGGLAGLAGAIEISGVTYRLYEDFSPGYGYMAIAVALLARLNPAYVVPSALFFGLLNAGSSSMQRVANVSAVMVQVVQAAAILLVVFLTWVYERQRG